MGEFSYKTTLPSESDATMLALDDALYFASHTNIYRADGDTFGVFSGVEGTVRHAAINGNNVFVCTEDKIVMNYGAHTVGTLRRRASAIDASEEFFAVGLGSVLEVWAVPHEYKFTLFRRLLVLPGHSDEIVFIKIVDANRILTAAADNTVRLFNLKNHDSVMLATTRSLPVGLHVFGAEQAAVTDGDGTVTHFSLGGGESRRFEIGMAVLCAASSGELLAVITESEAEENEQAAKRSVDHFHFGDEPEEEKAIDGQTGGIDENIIKPGITVRAKRCHLVVYKADEEIARIALDRRVSNLCMYNQRVAMRSRSFVGLFDLRNEKFVFCLDLPKIKGFAVEKDRIGAACEDGRVRIYQNLTCRCVLEDSKARGALLGVFLCKGSCIATYCSGHIAAFNIADRHCYRSFSIASATDPSDYLHSAATADGAIVFLATATVLAIVDVQRSRQIEEISLTAPLSTLVWHDNYLYYLDLHNRVTKYDYAISKATVLELEETGVSLAVYGKVLAVSTFSGVVLYDLDFGSISSLAVGLEARHREEVASKAKPAACIAMDSQLIACAGQSNQLKLLRREGAGGTALIPHALIQTLRVSANKDWENYKERLGKERKAPFSKKNFIETRQIAIRGGCLYVLTREGIAVFDAAVRTFNPLEFGGNASPEFVTQSIKDGNSGAALVAALQLGDYSLIHSAMAAVSDISFAAKYVPTHLMPILLDCVCEVLRADYTDERMLEFVKYAAYHHGIAAPHSLENIREGNAEQYESLRSCYYMLRNILKKTS